MYCGKFYIYNQCFLLRTFYTLEVLGFSIADVDAGLIDTSKGMPWRSILFLASFHAFPSTFDSSTRTVAISPLINYPALFK